MRRGTNKGNGSFTRGNNYRMTQAQAVILSQQLDKLVKETAIRRENADYLSAHLARSPASRRASAGKQPGGLASLPVPLRRRAVQRPAARYSSRRRSSAEGVPCGGVYHEQYYDGLLDEAIASRGFKRLWSAERLKAYRDSFQELKGNKQVCETTVAMTQNMLLADRSDMDHILEAIRKIQANSAALVKVQESLISKPLTL